LTHLIGFGLAAAIILQIHAWIARPRHSVDDVAAIPPRRTEEMFRNATRFLESDTGWTAPERRKQFCDPTFHTRKL